MQATKTSVPVVAASASSPTASATRPQQSDNHAVASAAPKKQIIHYPFWFGGSASSMAACVTHPLDLGMPSFVPFLVANA
jgi:dicarboxylate transporter 10